MRLLLPVSLSGIQFVAFCYLGCWRYFVLRDLHTSWKLITFYVGRLLVLASHILRLKFNFPFQVLRLFRVDEAHEIEGLDVVKHNEPAYPIGINLHWFSRTCNIHFLHFEPNCFRCLHWGGRSSSVLNYCLTLWRDPQSYQPVGQQTIQWTVATGQHHISIDWNWSYFFDSELCSNPPQCLNSPAAVQQAISCSHTSTTTTIDKTHHDEWRTAYFPSTYDHNSRNGSNGTTQSTTPSSVNPVKNSVNLNSITI